MTTFPSPWTRDTFTLTRFPGPTTIRYRSVVCKAATTMVSFNGADHEPVTFVFKQWRAEDPDLAEAHGLPRAKPSASRLDIR